MLKLKGKRSPMELCEEGQDFTLYIKFMTMWFNITQNWYDDTSQLTSRMISKNGNAVHTLITSNPNL